MLTGLVIALIVLAIIYGYVAMRPVPPIDYDFGPHKQSIESAASPDAAFGAIEAIASAGKYKLGRADATKRRVILQDGITAKSFGYYYPVDIAPSGAGSSVTVGIKSKYPFQFGPIVRRQAEKQLAVVIGDVQAKLAG